jgi:peroxiredoxin
VELPRLEKLYRKYSDKGLSVVAVEATRNREAAQQFIKENSLTFEFVESGKGENDFVRNVFKIRSFPTSFVVDHQGRIVFAHTGFSAGDEKTLEKEIKLLLEG